MSIQEIIEATKTLSQVERIELTSHLMVVNGIELQSLLNHNFSPNSTDVLPNTTQFPPSESMLMM